jgi:hypothetical protein
MGDEVGVYNDDEVKDLDDKEKALLKEHILNHIQTSAEIRRIVSADPTILTSNENIRRILRTKTGALQRRLKKKK